jgi:hypothetical protein
LAEEQLSSLPTVEELQHLGPEGARVLVRYLSVTAVRSRYEFWYGIAGMLCGSLTLIAAMALFAFLILHHEQTGAYALLGGTVLAVIGKMIDARLR